LSFQQNLFNHQEAKNNGRKQTQKHLNFERFLSFLADFAPATRCGLRGLAVKIAFVSEFC
jgi:hypothetical protein